MTERAATATRCVVGEDKVRQRGFRNEMRYKERDGNETEIKVNNVPPSGPVRHQPKDTQHLDSGTPGTNSQQKGNTTPPPLYLMPGKALDRLGVHGLGGEY
jgi:hypothetical protein